MLDRLAEIKGTAPPSADGSVAIDVDVRCALLVPDRIGWRLANPLVDVVYSPL